MGSIIRMHSKDFIKTFLPAIKPEDFQFVLISEDITTSEKFNNVKAIKRLMPPPHVITDFINENFKAYKKSYLNYIKRDEIEAFISIIVKAAVVNDLNLVLLCSKPEQEYKYTNLICEYIEQVYGMKTYTMEEYMKNPSKAGKVKNKDEIVQLLNKKFKKLSNSQNVNLDTAPDKERLIKELKSLDKHELRALAKKKKIKLDKDMKTKDMAKAIAKKLLA